MKLQHHLKQYNNIYILNITRLVLLFYCDCQKFNLTGGFFSFLSMVTGRGIIFICSTASKKVNHLSKVVWDSKIITEFTRSISSTRIGQPVLMMDVKVSKDKHIRRWVDWENSFILDEIESKTMHKDKEDDRLRKKK